MTKVFKELLKDLGPWWAARNQRTGETRPLHKSLFEHATALKRRAKPDPRIVLQKGDMATLTVTKAVDERANARRQTAAGVATLNGPVGKELIRRVLDAHRKGRLSAQDVERVNAARRAGLAIPGDVLRKLSEGA
jgi:hypothetical protein